jgi:hypothetical protein
MFFEDTFPLCVRVNCPVTTMGVLWWHYWTRPRTKFRTLFRILWQRRLYRNNINVINFPISTQPGTLPLNANVNVIVSLVSLQATSRLKAFSCRDAGSPASLPSSCQRQHVSCIYHDSSSLSFSNKFDINCPYRCDPKLQYDKLPWDTWVILVCEAVHHTTSKMLFVYSFIFSKSRPLSTYSFQVYVRV